MGNPINNMGLIIYTLHDSKFKEPSTILRVVRNLNQS